MKYLNPFYYAFSMYEWINEKKYQYLANNTPTKQQKIKASLIRKKDKIKVAFIVYDIAKWRSESLYRQMLQHPRFEPVIVVIAHYPFYADYNLIMQIFESTVDTVKKKGYSYVIGKKSVDIDVLVKPDIIFYGEAYSGAFDSTYEMGTQREPLGCYLPYSMHNTNLKRINNLKPLNLNWMTFVENQATFEDLRLNLDNKGRNTIVTGLPLQDEMLSASDIKNDWKDQAQAKKHIIWAPSHTIQGVDNAYYQSTFLEIADEMLVLAKKYSDHIQWAFKPHPSLKAKLMTVWGEKKTIAYYEKWAMMPNTQLEEGQFRDLFLTSDAMIHDCQSFMVEYMFTGNPVMYIEADPTSSRIFNTQTMRALDVHYKGANINDIENFIINTVIGGQDPLKPDRLEYKSKFLIPPHGKKSIENIINAILGEEEYSYLREQ